MLIRNFLMSPLQDAAKIHDGCGIAKHVSLFDNKDFSTNLRFINYTILPSGVSIGSHKHGDDEELYIILEGNGEMTVNGEVRSVTAGDIIVNPPFGSHELVNNSDSDLKILVMEVFK